MVFVGMLMLTMFLVACGGGNNDTGVNNDGGNAGGGDGDAINLRFAHEEGQGDVQDLYANKFKEIMEDKSGGDITVDVYTAGQVGSNMDVLQSLQTGAIEI